MSAQNNGSIRKMSSSQVALIDGGRSNGTGVVHQGTLASGKEARCALSAPRRHSPLAYKFLAVPTDGLIHALPAGATAQAAQQPPPRCREIRTRSAAFDFGQISPKREQ